MHLWGDGKQSQNLAAGRNEFPFKFQLPSTKVIERIPGPGIEAGGMSNWSNELLPIPATVPSICCRILKLSYVLHLTLALRYSLDLHVAIPITIGNMPFRGGQPATNSYPPVGNPPVQTSYPPEGSPYPPPDVNAPPATSNPYPPPIGTPYPSSAYNYSAAYPPVNIGDDNYTMEETQCMVL